MTSDLATRAPTPRPKAPASDARNAVHADAPLRQRVGRFDFAAHACFACGHLNVHGLRLALHASGDRCWTEIAIPAAFQGWEGITHGGVVSAILDEVMAWSLIGTDQLGFTARLEVEFRRPVPVDRLIRAEGWIEERRRRRFNTAATLLDVETEAVLAVAKGVYLAAPIEQQTAMRARYDIRPVDEAEA